MKYLGICDIIDWDSVIKSLEHQTPTYIGPSHKLGDPIPGLSEVTDIWQRAKFGANAEWDMFISGDAFDISIAEQFMDYVGIDNYNTCWISRIRPGKMAPWHWDVNDNEAELGEFRRFHCHIGKPVHGHVLVVDDKCLYNQPQGSTYEWNSRKSWHAGMNAGLTPKYLFNIW